MPITIDLMDLLLVLLMLAGLVLGTWFVVVLVRASKALKQVSGLLDTLREPLSDAAERLPALLERADAMTKDAAALTASARETVPDILKDAKGIAGSVRKGVDAVGSAATNLNEGVSSVFGTVRDTADTVETIVTVLGHVFDALGFLTGSGKKKGRKRRR